MVDPFSQEISLLSTSGRIDESQRWEMHKIAIGCQFFITGTNVVTKDGKLFNTDAGESRPPGMILARGTWWSSLGRNKIVPDLDAAFERMKTVVAPALCRMKERRLPCVVTGSCTDCDSAQRACNVTTILEKRPTYTPFTVVLVDADLGLGWDPGWPGQNGGGQILSSCGRR